MHKQPKVFHINSPCNISYKQAKTRNISWFQKVYKILKKSSIKSGEISLTTAPQTMQTYPNSVIRQLVTFCPLLLVPIFLVTTIAWLILFAILTLAVVFYIYLCVGDIFTFTLVSAFYIIILLTHAPEFIIEKFQKNPFRFSIFIIIAPLFIFAYIIVDELIIKWLFIQCGQKMKNVFLGPVEMYPAT